MDDLDPHVAAGLYGTPKINPDEQRKYLGTFRERVYAAQTIATMGDATYMSVWQEQIRTHQDGTLLINGHVDSDIVDQYMKLATSGRIGFTLVTNPDYKTDPDRIGVVLAAKTAVNVDVIDVTKMVTDTPQTSEKQTTTDNPGFFKKFFG
jgi:uncharacterized protein YueI